MTADRRENGGRRAKDQAHGWRALVRDNWYRDLWLLLVSGFVVWAVLAFGGKADQAGVDSRIAKATALSQAEGRRNAISVLCGFGNGVEKAGKATLAAPIMPPKFRRALEHLGLPSKAIRRRGSKAAGEAYARAISRSVVEQAGVDARAVIKPDGSLNCPALQDIAKTAPLP